jgi:hypothetical protein
VATTVTKDEKGLKIEKDSTALTCALLDGQAPTSIMTGWLQAQTAYRGQLLGSLYHMDVRVDVKFVCRGAKKLEIWTRAVNQRDDYPPGRCEMESWRLSDIVDI